MSVEGKSKEERIPLNPLGRGISNETKDIKLEFTKTSIFANIIAPLPSTTYFANASTLASFQNSESLKFEWKSRFNFNENIETVNCRTINDKSYVGAITEKGNGSLFSVNQDGSINLMYDFKDTTSGDFESGWSGFDINPLDSSKVVTSRYFKKSLTFFNGDQVERRIFTNQFPNQIKYLTPESMNSNFPLVGITEGKELSIWDFRVSSNDGCIKRLSPTQVNMFTFDSSSKGPLIGVGGENRVIFVFDSRKWNVKGTWSSCQKYEVMNSFFSSENEEYCYVSGGMDSEVAFGHWTTGNSTSRRCDGRILGFRKFQNEDKVSLLTTNGTVYVFHHPDQLVSEKKKLKRDLQDDDSKFVSL